ncbi:hypothetical protein CGBL_0127110 [Corynebacterium glutamicum]|nr:hypothetical protein CGBL_0127110 [Corynebacterium glutamicum]
MRAAAAAKGSQAWCAATLISSPSANATSRSVDRVGSLVPSPTRFRVERETPERLEMRVGCSAARAINSSIFTTNHANHHGFSLRHRPTLFDAPLHLFSSVTGANPVFLAAV